MLCKKTVKNQITLPKAIADRFRDVVYFDASLQEGRIMLKPVRIEDADGPTREAIRRKIEKLGIRERDIEAAIRQARRGEERP